MMFNGIKVKTTFFKSNGYFKAGLNYLICLHSKIHSESKLLSNSQFLRVETVTDILFTIKFQIHINNRIAILFRFVRYQDCVLPEEMIGSGSMERIRDFKARSGDVFVSSFPKSGTTWVQEVVNQLMICQCCKNVRQLQDPTEQKAVDSIVNCNLILNSVRNFFLLFFFLQSHFVFGS